MVSGGMTCVKYVLFAFNLLFAVSGITILIVGACIHIFYSDYSNFVYDNYQSAPIVLIVVGVIIFVVAFFGCCGAVKENQCMIITFAVLLLAIITIEISTGVVGYVRRNEVEKMLQNKLNSTMYDYYTNKDIQKTWDIAQHEIECCGMHGFKDWRNVTHTNALPHTCCPNAPDDGTCTSETPTKYTKSCFDALKNAFLKYGCVIGGVGIGIAVTQLIGVIFACCLARSVSAEYLTV